MFKLDDDILRQLRATFQVEAAEHIQAMNRILLELEQNPEGEKRAELFEEIFREAHSLKGAAGAADFAEVEKIAHKLESAFGATRTGKIKLTRDLCDVLFEGIDTSTTLLNAALEDKPHGVNLSELAMRLDAAAEGRVIHSSSKPQTPQPATPQPETPPPNGHDNSTPAQSVVPSAANEAKTQPPKTDERKKAPGAITGVEETIRVATEKIDLLMAQAGELMVAGLKIEQRFKQVEQIHHSIEDWDREWLKFRATQSTLLRSVNQEDLRPLIKLLDANQAWLKTLLADFSNLQRGFSHDTIHLSRSARVMEESVMKVRMLPVSTVFDAFPRLVRDVARESGKEVELKMEGAETELDRKVLEEIKDPLIHLLRNSVDHGIEKPEVRIQAGKPRTGTITLQAFQKGNTIVVNVSDDGGGINRDKVKQAAVKAGSLSASEAQNLSDDEALRLIFMPGLSTSNAVTAISGRGVGMDVVKKNVEVLQGQIDIDSTLGVGTTITLTLPLTLATTQQLLVQIGEQQYGIPISAVERIMRVNQKEISALTGRSAITVEDTPVMLMRLGDVLELPSGEQRISADGRLPVVILTANKKRVAFLVDDVIGQQETVVKSLGKQLARIRNVTGATILGSGKVIITLNPVDLMKSARGGERQATAAPPRANVAKKMEDKRRTVLVVDDSLSTRTLEKNILETAGYKVQVAVDGAEAMSLLNSNVSCDLIVSDIMMPRMSGLELTAAVRADPKLKKIPVILVTSLDSREDKERGIGVGADAYVIKSNFDQSGLLQTIAQLI